MSRPPKSFDAKNLAHPKASASIDPALENALQGEPSDLVSLFIKLTAVPGGSAKSKGRAHQAYALIQRVSKTTVETRGLKFNYRELDDVLHVKASTQFIRNLLTQPEVLSASAQIPRFHSALIRPVGPGREVGDSAIDRSFSLSRL